MKITVDVTQPLIDAGKKGNCNDCPIALAIKPHFPEHNVFVDGGSVAITSKFGDKKYATLPVEAVDFLNNFDEPLDDTTPSLPFSFELEFYTLL